MREKNDARMKAQDKYSTSQLFNFARDSYFERTSRPIYAIIFLLPEGWEYITEDALPNKYRTTLKEQFISKTLAICQKTGAEYFTTPYILVQVKSSQEMSEVQGDASPFLGPLRARSYLGNPQAFPITPQQRERHLHFSKSRRLPTKPFSVAPS